MAVIVDCYNVLHVSMPMSLAGLDEAGLCRLMARGPWARGQGRLVVVCDGRPKPLGTTQSPAPAVELVYAGRGRSADGVIMDMIARDSAPRRLLVVSSDREIQRAARRRRAKVCASDAFVRELASVRRNPGRNTDHASAKTSDAGLPPDEVREWLDTFGIAPESSPAADSSARRPSSRRSGPGGPRRRSRRRFDETPPGP